MTIASGPQPANVLILGEAPGVNEERTRQPFVGASGQELTKMLHEAGFIRTECRITNVTSSRPPNNDISRFFPKRAQLKGNEQLVNGRTCSAEILQGLMDLKREIAVTRPKVIIALGDTALWALTGHSGITKWRGSLLRHESGAWVIPTYHPAAILRMWSWRFIAVHDFRKASRQLTDPVTEPTWNFITSPSIVDARCTLSTLLFRLNSGEHLHLAVDIETRSGHIDCIGVAWNGTQALCIPFCRMAEQGSYWTLDEETELLWKLRQVLTHPNAKVVGQNFLYDASYMAKWWGWWPTPDFDTMIAQGVAFPGMLKSLDFLSSLYLDWHVYWKDEAGEADEKIDDDTRWNYNCKDCCATWSLVHPLTSTIKSGNLEAPFRFEMSLFNPLMYMMMRGVRIDKKLRTQFSFDLMEAASESADWFERLGQGVWRSDELVKSKSAAAWYDSPTQQRKIFYELLHLPVQRNRKTGKPSVDDEALKKLAKQEPLLLPFVSRMIRYRSFRVFKSTFVDARLDHDDRIRTSYNPVGTETLRFNSKIDAFGIGMNLQNIPAGD